MKLSKRLQMIADCITKDSRTADIGCDHAYLSIYLIKNNIVPSVIAMDVNKGPLLHARQNIIKYCTEGKIELRLSDGLTKLAPLEADTIVIAGMGGELMKSILQRGLPCVKAAKELVLQPQSEIYKVRRMLKNIGFKIIYENMCIDEEKYYVVIKAVNKEYDLKSGLVLKKDVEFNKNVETNKDVEFIKISNIESDAESVQENNRELNEIDTYDNITAEEIYGGFLLNQKNDILHTYLKKELTLNHSIQDKLINNPTCKSFERLNECKEEEKRLMDALSYYIT